MTCLRQVNYQRFPLQGSEIFLACYYTMVLVIIMQQDSEKYFFRKYSDNSTKLNLRENENLLDIRSLLRP